MDVAAARTYTFPCNSWLGKDMVSAHLVSHVLHSDLLSNHVVTSTNYKLVLTPTLHTCLQSDDSSLERVLLPTHIPLTNEATSSAPSTKQPDSKTQASAPNAALQPVSKLKPAQMPSAGNALSTLAPQLGLCTYHVVLKLQDRKASSQCGKHAAQALQLAGVALGKQVLICLLILVCGCVCAIL